VERLKDAVACFILQDYPAKRLVILNDAPVPIDCSCTCPSITTVNWHDRSVLGVKRQRLLEAATTRLVSHWDDDDLYLPWHLGLMFHLYRRYKKMCVNPANAWWASGPRDALRLDGSRYFVFEGQMFFDRYTALRLGGYPPVTGPEAFYLLRSFMRARQHVIVKMPESWISYVYRWNDNLGHTSGGLTNRWHDEYALRNRDFGDGKPLIEGDPQTWATLRLRGQFHQLLQFMQQRLRREDSTLWSSVLGEKD
jgi:hypothetical protein